LIAVALKIISVGCHIISSQKVLENSAIMYKSLCHWELQGYNVT